MPLMKLQTDIDYELIQKLEKHKADSGKSKAAIVAEALREYFERQENPEPPARPHVVVPLPLVQPQMTYTGTTGANVTIPGPASAADLFPEDEPEGAPASVNVENPMTPEDERLVELKERLAASKSGKEIDELTREIGRVEGELTMRLLNALPGAE